LGEHKKVLIASVPEGDDKPYKYPVMFNQSDLVILNKIDLLPYVKFDRQRFSDAVRGLNKNATIIEISCTTGEGIEKWLEWLATAVACRSDRGLTRAANVRRRT
jgi:hydrogenase nickel incorporation protein HypB